MSDQPNAGSGSEWAEHIGREVIFRYHHGEEVAGVVTSTNERYVFVRFGASKSSEACEPSMLRLAVPTPITRSEAT